MPRRTNDLEHEQTWDFQHAEHRPAARGTRTVVSVAFPQKDFALVAEEAERARMKLSEFIRTAAINEAAHQRRQATVFTTSGTPGFASYTITSPTTTHNRARLKEELPAITG